MVILSVYDIIHGSVWGLLPRSVSSHALLHLGGTHLGVTLTPPWARHSALGAANFWVGRGRAERTGVFKPAAGVSAVSVVEPVAETRGPRYGIGRRIWQGGGRRLWVGVVCDPLWGSKDASAHSSREWSEAKHNWHERDGFSPVWPSTVAARREAFMSVQERLAPAACCRRNCLSYRSHPFPLCFRTICKIIMP